MWRVWAGEDDEAVERILGVGLVLFALVVDVVLLVSVIFYCIFVFFRGIFFRKRE